MNISEIMTRKVETITPDQTIQQAAAIMARVDCGALMVHKGDKLAGMITDRDIAIRAVAEGLSCDTPVSKVMSSGIRYCFEDEDVQDVARNMAQNQVRRMPVMNRDKRLVGVISLGNISDCGDSESCTTLLHGVANAHGVAQAH
jgi:CBS domain-containing protein